MRVAAVAIATVGLCVAARSARAQDRFEIQVYDVETAPRGEPGLEVHANHTIVDGAPDQAHLTFEPHLGLAPWAELGGYIQTALDTSGSGGWGGVKLRVKLRWPRRVWDERIGLGINGEVSAVPARYEPAEWGSELRPIVDLQAGRVYASVNPIVDVDLAGSLAGHPQFQPAAKLAFDAGRGVWLGVEGYAALGPFDDLGSEKATRLLAAIDLHGAWWDLNAGAGPAWGSPDRAVVKIIFGIHPRAR